MQAHPELFLPCELSPPGFEPRYLEIFAPEPPGEAQTTLPGPDLGFLWRRKLVASSCAYYPSGSQMSPPPPPPVGCTFLTLSCVQPLLPKNISLLQP